MQTIKGVMRAVGGTGYETVMREDWEKIEREFTAMDLLNVDQCFELTPERRKWVNDLLQKRLQEEAVKIEDPVAKAVFLGNACWMKDSK